MNRLLIKNAKAILDDGIFCRDVLIEDGKIADVSFSGKLPSDCEVMDINGKYLSPGFIDIHLHGGGGFDFMQPNLRKT